MPRNNLIRTNNLKLEFEFSKNSVIKCKLKINQTDLPQKVLNRIGLRPNLSDHGPIKTLIKAGMILSKTARAINIFDAYVSNFASRSYAKYTKS